MEISRERVPLRNAYRHVGQQAVLRVNSGEEYTLQGAHCSWAMRKAADISCSHVLLWTVSALALHTHCGSADLCRPLCNAVSTAPFPLRMQQQPLYHARGDLTAGETKAVREPTSVTGRLEVSSWRGQVPSADEHCVDQKVMQLACRRTHRRHDIHMSGLCSGENQVLVPEGEAKDLLEASAADTVEVGPFQVRLDAVACLLSCTRSPLSCWLCAYLLAAPDEVSMMHCPDTSASAQGAGLNLRGNIIGAFRYRTVLIMCEGLAIATARALIEAESSVGGLNFPLRENVVLYYRVGILVSPVATLSLSC